MVRLYKEERDSDDGKGIWPTLKARFGQEDEAKKVVIKVSFCGSESRILWTQRNLIAVKLVIRIRVL